MHAIAIFIPAQIKLAFVAAAPIERRLVRRVRRTRREVREERTRGRDRLLQLQPVNTIRRQIAREVVQISEKARAKGLSIAEMAGGCFTLSSLGHIGGTGFTPIINAPEVAILGICRTQHRFMPDANGNAVLKQLLPLSLSYDHRVINGADAARFLAAVKERLESWDMER